MTESHGPREQTRIIRGARHAKRRSRREPLPGSDLASALVPALVAAGVYMVGMAVAWLVAPFPYSDPRVVFAITPVLLVLCGLMIGLAVIFRVPAWGGLGWDLSALWIVVPTGLLLGKLIVVLAQRGASPLLIAQIFLGTLLVGVGEELAFRGIALTSLTRHYSPLVAVLGSAALFGLMHSVNILARQSVAEVAIQVVLTTAFGIAFGWVYLNTGRNLLIVVACHALWDFGGIAAGAAHQGFAAAALAAELIIWTGAVVLSVRGSRRPVSPPSPRTRPTADPSRASSAPRRASRTRPRPTGGET